MNSDELEEKLLSTVEHEKKLLSALMLEEGRGVPVAAEILSPDDFYRPEHKLIYKALLELSGEGVPLDPLAVEYKLGEDLKKVTRQYLYGLVLLEYTVERVEYQAETVKELANLRRLAEIGQQMTYAAWHDKGTSSEILAETESKLTAMVSKTTKSVMSALDHVNNFIESLTNPDARNEGIQTKFLYLDKYTGGLKKSDLIILAARPSMGKTALALNIAMRAAAHNTVMIFSLEMSKAQVIDRLISSEAKVHATRVQQRVFSDGELSAVLSAAESLSQRKYFIDDARVLTLAEIKNKAARIKREHGLDLIVIDYLQLIQCANRYSGNRNNEISELSRGLKCLAGDLDVPVLALSQLNRNSESRADKKPLLSDLRDSGSIEQDADIVMLLHRDEYYDHDDSKKAELIIAKNRNGATGTVLLKFEKEYLLFDNFTEADLR